METQIRQASALVPKVPFAVLGPTQTQVQKGGEGGMNPEALATNWRVGDCTKESDAYGPFVIIGDAPNGELRRIAEVFPKPPATRESLGAATDAARLMAAAPDLLAALKCLLHETAAIKPRDSLGIRFCRQQAEIAIDLATGYYTEDPYA